MATEMKRSVKSGQRDVRILAVELDGTAGTPAAAGLDALKIASVTDNGVGDYTLELKIALAAAPQVLVQCQTADAIATVVAKTASTVQVQCFDATDGTTAKDCLIDLLIIGSDVTDRY